jgi:hypothetical protein
MKFEHPTFDFHGVFVVRDCGKKSREESLREMGFGG